MTADARKAHQDAVEALQDHLTKIGATISWDEALTALDHTIASLHAAGWRVVPVEWLDLLSGRLQGVINGTMREMPPFPPSED